jgi:hypothetical protein
MTDGALPDELDLEAGVDAPLSAEERHELEQLGTLLRSARDFDLAPAARAHGRAELEALLQERTAPVRAKRTPPRRLQARPWLWLAAPLAAGILFTWLDPLSLRHAPAPAAPTELAIAQSALLTAELTGAPVARDDLERATRTYRQELLASLEKGR